MENFLSHPPWLGRRPGQMRIPGRLLEGFPEALRIKCRFAEGGMSVLYLGEIRCGPRARPVLVKTIAPTDKWDSIGGNRIRALMLRHEGRITRRLRHPNTVRCLGYGSAKVGPFVVYELLEGVTLQQLVDALVARRQPLPVEIAVWVVARIADALSALHGLSDAETGRPLRAVHSDVSPCNVLVTKTGTPKLLDFGACRSTLLDRAADAFIVGKLGYLSPEQLRAKEATERSDVYALGVVLYELLTQARLYRFESISHALLGTSGAPPASLKSRRPELDATLSDLVELAMRRDRAARLPSAALLRDELDAWLAGRGAADPAGAVRALMSNIEAAPCASSEARTIIPGTMSQLADGRAARQGPIPQLTGSRAFEVAAATTIDPPTKLTTRLVPELAFA